MRVCRVHNIALPCPALPCPLCCVLCVSYAVFAAESPAPSHNTTVCRCTARASGGCDECQQSPAGAAQLGGAGVHRCCQCAIVARL